ncbi:MAG TPA: T9SS type A sorting domain-containing protein [Ignavibacteria bacterium]|nr:T9SS type A sorting domain-containing protein [Ignavibacteria bacterium]
MKMKSFLFISTFIFFNFSTTNLFSQFDDLGQDCGTNLTLGGYQNIPVKTPGTSDFIRCLVIYITFPDDTLSGYNYTIWKNRFQTSNPRPINPHSGTNGHLIDSLVGNPNVPFMTRYHDYTISDFFCEMSMGQYDVIGDEISIILPRNSSYYRDSLHLINGRGFMNRYVLNYLDSTRNIDWSRYDNWKFQNNEWLFESDGTAEMILMNYRTIPNNSNGWFWPPAYGGEAKLDLPSPITFGSVTIGPFNGITALNLLHATGRSEVILEHEYSHKLFANNIPLGDNGHVNMGFMTLGHNETSYLYTPIERSATIIGYTSINLINSNGIYTDTLSDFVESGKSYKIKIPGTSDDYIWIANHQKKSVYDGIARGGTNCYNINFAEIDPACPDGKGLFIYREGSNCSNNNQPYDIVSAEGKFSWAIDRTVYAPHQNYHHPLGFSLPVLKTMLGKRYTGKDKYMKQPANPTTAYGTWVTDDVCSDESSDFDISLSFRGDSFDPFNMNYDEIFSPYSNPSSSFCDSTRTGLTIALMEQNSTTGAIVVKIYYDNDDQAILDLPPSKPKNVKVIKSYFGGFGSDKFHPSISWDQNTEPDFYSASNGPTGIAPVFEIYRGGSSNCNVEPSYVLAATVSSTTTQYTDSEVTLHDPNIDQISICPPTLATFSYKIIAKDNRGKRSLNSERGFVSGYQNGCADPEGPDSPTGMNTLPDKFSINNYPNPFNPSTKIYYSLPKDGMVKINIYNNLGQKVKEIVNEFKITGRYNIEFDGSNLPSGIYYYKIETNGFIQTKKMLLIK